MLMMAARLLASQELFTRARQSWRPLAGAIFPHQESCSFSSSLSGGTTVALATACFMGLIASPMADCEKAEFRMATPKDHGVPTVVETGERKDPSPLRVCGEWCSSSPPDEPCTMDTDLVKCESNYCQTTAGLWSLFVLGPRNKPRPVSCDLYKAGLAYPIGAKQCQASCLIDEVNPKRYPLPTGLGVFCRPGTCSPGATPHPECGKGLGTLQCPCNWFGSECQNEWLPIQRIQKKRMGCLDKVTLKLVTENWQKIVADYRPGCVVRINMKDDISSIYEMSCAVARCNVPGEIEVLVAQPNAYLRPEVTHVNAYLCSLPYLDAVPVKPIFVNPAISGFYNGQYEYLMDYVNDTTCLDQLVVLATGAGLGGALSAIEAMVGLNQKCRQEKQSSLIKIHLYYGLRNMEDLPYRERLNDLVEKGLIQLTLVESRSVGPDADGALQAMHTDGIQRAALRGETIKRKIIRSHQANRNDTDMDKKVYVQHVLEFDLEQGGLQPLENTAFVICGRLQVMDDAQAIFRRTCFKGGESLAEERVFLNI